MSPGAPHDQAFQLFSLDNDGWIAMEMWFDLEDMDAAIAELDALQARFEDERPPGRRLENAASQVYERIQACFVARDWDAMASIVAPDVVDHDRRHMVNAGIRRGRDAHIAEHVERSPSSEPRT